MIAFRSDAGASEREDEKNVTIMLLFNYQLVMNRMLSAAKSRLGGITIMLLYSEF